MIAVGEEVGMREADTGEGDRGPVDVLYIASKGRSGSTVLGRILGEIDGFAFLGEVNLASRALRGRRLCSCGVRVEDCATWGAIRRNAGGGADPELDAALFGFGRALRSRHLPFAMLAGGDRWLSRRLAGPLTSCAHLYRAIHTALKAPVVVDSSKSPSYGYLLSLVPGIRLHLVHLVRDPRAVAYSSGRPKRSSIVAGERHASRGPVSSAGAWVLSNLWAELCWRRAPGRRLRLRYEDLVAEPRPSLTRIVELVRGDAADLPLVGDRTVVCHAGHTVAGNVDRFFTGPIALVPDDEWKVRMRGGDHRVVTALTWPLLLRYGYPGTAGRRCPPASATPER
jgi:hypothetical protein